MKYRAFRYGYTSMFVIAGLVISFLVFSYFDGVMHEEQQEIYDERQMSYVNEVYSLAYGEAFDYNSIISENLKNIIVTLTGVMVYVDEAGCCYNGEVLLGRGELNYPLVKGRYPTQNELVAGENVVVLGQQLRQFTKRKKGDDYISLCGDEYRVTGYLGCESSTVVDYSIIVYANCLLEGLFEDIHDYGDAIGYSIVFQSNMVSEQHILEHLSPYLESEDYSFVIMDENPRFFASRDVSQTNKKYAILTYVFSIIIIILVIEYWLICRRKEFAIRKAFGYTSDRLMLRMISELFLYLLISIVISECLLLVFNIFEKRAVVFMVKSFWGRLVDLMKYAGITICVLMVRPMYEIYVDNPVEMLINKENS